MPDMEQKPGASAGTAIALMVSLIALPISMFGWLLSKKSSYAAELFGMMFWIALGTTVYFAVKEKIPQAQPG